MFKEAFLLLETANVAWKEEIATELYNYIFVKCPPEERPYLELEAKLGTFVFNANSSVFGLITDIFKLPAIQNSKSWFVNFDSQVTKEDFFSLWMFVEKEMKKPNSGIIRKEPLNIEEHFYQTGKRRSVVSNERKEVIDEYVILKTEKQHSNVRNNGKDFRVTICKEIPSETANNDKEVSQRLKYRLSYEFRFFSLDLTVVKEGMQEKYEIEFEMNKLSEYLSQEIDFFQFSYLIKRFLENILVFYRVMSEDYFSLMYGASDKMTTYGDYMKSYGLIN